METIEVGMLPGLCLRHWVLGIMFERGIMSEGSCSTSMMETERYKDMTEKLHGKIINYEVATNIIIYVIQ